MQPLIIRSLTYSGRFECQIVNTTMQVCILSSILEIEYEYGMHLGKDLALISDISDRSVACPLCNLRPIWHL